MPTKKKPTKTPRTKKSSATEAKSRPAQSEGIVLDKINAALGWIKNHIMLTILIAVGVGAMGWYGYTSLIKWQFSQAEEEVQTLSSAIVAELGTPTSTDTLKSCSYQSLKYAYGQTDAMCSVGNTILYSGDATEAERISRLVKNILNDTRRNITFSSEGNYENAIDSSELNSATNSYFYNNFSCTTIVRYISQGRYEEKNVEIYLGCGKKVNFYRIYPEL